MLKTSVQRNKPQKDESGLSAASSSTQTRAITFELESKMMPRIMLKNIWIKKGTTATSTVIRVRLFEPSAVISSVDHS